MSNSLSINVETLTNPITSLRDFFYPQNPITQKRHFWFIPTWYEDYLGRNLFISILARRGGELDDEKMQRKIERVGNKLINHITRKGIFDYEFVVMDTRAITSWALPGGKVAVHKGLMDGIIKDDKVKGYYDITEDDKIAAVLAHEVAHCDIGHSARRLEKVILFNLALLILKVSISVATLFLPTEENIPKMDNDNSDLFTRVMGNLVIKLYFLASSRSDEFEADRFSIDYMKKAGYNPRAKLWLMEYLKTKEYRFPKPVKLFYEYCVSTHPSADSRLEAIKKTLLERGISLEKKKFCRYI